MKNKCLLFSLILSFCLILVSGCGETTYDITTSVNDEEYGYISGAGKYVMGSTVNLKMYPNYGCEIKELKFENSENIGFESVEGEDYYLASFVVTDKTIGNYAAQFDCMSNEISGDKYLTKYKVKYLIKRDGYTINNPFQLENTDNGTGYEEIVAGRKITRNISYVYGIEGFNFNTKVLKWYTDSECQNEFKYLETPITQDITLYGKEFDLEYNNELQNAINMFKNTDNMIITSSIRSTNTLTEKATIYKFVNDAKTQDTQIGIQKVGSGTNPYLYAYKMGKASSQKAGIDYYAYGDYYEYRTGGDSNNGKYAKLNLSTSQFSLKDIDNIYRYIKIKDITISENTELEANATCDYESNGVVRCYTYNGYDFILVNGMIRVFKDSKYSYEIEYDAKTTSLTILNSVDMYSVKIVLEKEDGVTGDLDLNSVNNNFDKSIRIVPALNENLENKLNNNASLKEILSDFDYSWHQMNGTNCKTGKGSEYNFQSSISGNMNICLLLTSSSSEFKEAIENTKYFNIGAELNAFDETIVKKYYNVDSVSSTIDGVDKITSHLMEKLKSYISTGTDALTPLFKKQEDGSYDIYDQDNTTKIMSITLTEGSNKKIKEITYIYEGVSYEYTFKGVLENAIENMTNFAYINGEILSSLYSGIQNIENYAEDSILNNLVLIQKGNLAYTLNSDGNYTATIGDNEKIIIELTDNKDRILKVTLKKAETQTKSYEFIDKLAYGIRKLENFTISSEITVYGETVSKTYTTLGAIPSSEELKNDNDIDDVTKSLFGYLNNLKDANRSYTVSKDDIKSIYRVYEVVEQDIVLVLEVYLNNEGVDPTISKIKFTSGLTYLYTFDTNA